MCIPQKQSQCGYCLGWHSVEQGNDIHIDIHVHACRFTQHHIHRFLEASLHTVLVTSFVLLHTCLLFRNFQQNSCKPRAVYCNYYTNWYIEHPSVMKVLGLANDHSIQTEKRNEYNNVIISEKRSDGRMRYMCSYT